MTLNLEAIKARCEKATAGHTCTETPYGCLRCESEIDSLDAECLLLVAEVERLRKVEALGMAWYSAVRKRQIVDGDTAQRQANLEILCAEADMYAALDAAQGGG